MPPNYNLNSLIIFDHSFKYTLFNERIKYFRCIYSYGYVLFVKSGNALYNKFIIMTIVTGEEYIWSN
jgi:hypothetical protein